MRRTAPVSNLRKRRGTPIPLTAAWVCYRWTGAGYAFDTLHIKKKLAGNSAGKTRGTRVRHATQQLEPLRFGRYSKIRHSSWRLCPFRIPKSASYGCAGAKGGLLPAKTNSLSWKIFALNLIPTSASTFAPAFGLLSVLTPSPRLVTKQALPCSFALSSLASFLPSFPLFLLPCRSLFLRQIDDDTVNINK